MAAPRLFPHLRSEENGLENPEVSMKPNIGPNERFVCLLGGSIAAVAALPLTPAGWWRLPLAIVAATGVLTALSRYCPAKQALGINNAAEEEPASTEEPLIGASASL
jgi:hypothetical protein